MPYLKATGWVGVTALAHLLAVYGITLLTLGENRIDLDRYLRFSFSVYGLLAVGYIYVYALYLLAWSRPRAGVFKAYAAGLQRQLLSSGRLLFSFPVLVIVPLSASVFSSFKSLIPDIEPFKFDRLFAAWDRALYGGTDAWRILQPVFGHPIATYVISYLYHTAWFFILIVTVLWHALGTHALALRVRFFVCYLLIWALPGNVLALLWSSAGPCFFDLATGVGSPFSAQIDFLRAVDAEIDAPLQALVLQDYLAGHYEGDRVGFATGISAMPSVHVASTLLFALAAWQVNRVIGALHWCYLITVLIGSVHLGWHYSIDGFVGMFVTVLLWRVIGRVLATGYGNQPKVTDCKPDGLSL